jgi:serine/threonine protein kinase
MEKQSFESYNCYIDPKQFNDFNLISHGAHANVYKATYKGRAVILKDFCGYKLEAFRHEAVMMEGLKHSNVLACYGVTSVRLIESTKYQQIVFEYAPKGTLKERIAQAVQDPMTCRERMLIAKEIALGMEYLHSKKIIHRSLIAEDIVLKNDGTVAISDFQLAVDDLGDKHDYGKIDGFPRSAPEVFRGELYDSSSDVYSYGMLLLELIFQKRLEELHGKYLQNGQVLIEHFLRIMPSDEFAKMLIQIVKRCVAERADDRPSFKVLASEITELCKIYLDPKGFDKLVELRPGSNFFKGIYEKSDVVVLNDVSFTSSEEFYKQFNMLRDSQSKNVVTLLGITYIKDLPSPSIREQMVFKYYPGGNLKEKLSKPLGCLSQILIARDVARAMSYIHSKNITLNTLNSENILIKSDGTSVVANFKRAMMVEPHQKLQAEKSDLNSYGVLLVHLITGKANGETVTQRDMFDVDKFMEANSSYDNDENRFLASIAKECFSPTSESSFRNFLSQIEGYTFHVNETELKDVKLTKNGHFYDTYSASYNNKNVVIKVLISEDFEIFENELEITKRLDHLNLIRFLGVTSCTRCKQSKSNKQIVFQCVEGVKLSNKLKEKSSFSYLEVASLANSIASAMAYLHLNNVTHQRLSPNCITLDLNGTAVVTDTGVGNIFQDDYESISMYNVPESLKGRPIKNDVYSFGVLLCEMLRQDIYRLEISYKDGMIDMKKSHINLILAKEALVLHDLAMKCVEENPRARPTFAAITLDLTKMIISFNEEREKLQKHLESN